MTDPIRVNLSTNHSGETTSQSVDLGFGKKGLFVNIVDAAQDYALIDTDTHTVKIYDGDVLIKELAVKDVASFNAQDARDIYGTCITNGLNEAVYPPIPSNGSTVRDPNVKPYQRPAEELNGYGDDFGKPARNGG